MNSLLTGAHEALRGGWPDTRKKTLKFEIEIILPTLVAEFSLQAAFAAYD